MRQRFLPALAIVAIAGIVFGCGRPAAEVTSEQAEEAFLLSFSLVMIGSMSAGFGQPLDGTTYDVEKGTLTFTDVKTANLGIESPYTTVNGTATASETTIAVDLKLDGGSVQTITYELTEAQLQDENSISARIKVNGKDMDIVLTQ